MLLHPDSDAFTLGREKMPDNDNNDDSDHSPPVSSLLANFSGSQRKYVALHKEQAEQASRSKEATVSAIFSFISACSFFSGFGQ